MGHTCLERFSYLCTNNFGPLLSKSSTKRKYFKLGEKWRSKDWCVSIPSADWLIEVCQSNFSDTLILHAFRLNCECTVLLAMQALFTLTFSARVHNRRTAFLIVWSLVAPAHSERGQSAAIFLSVLTRKGLNSFTGNIQFFIHTSEGSIRFFGIL